MFLLAALLLVITPASLAEKVLGCDEYDNVGVYNEFGSLPSKLRNSVLYYQEIMVGRPYTAFEPEDHKGYMLEYEDFREQRGFGTGRYSYYKVMFKYDGQYRTLDYVRINPDKFKVTEKAILSADSYPGRDNKLKIKYLLSDCNCVMRVYDLRVNDIMSYAETVSCGGTTIMSTPHKVSQQTNNYMYKQDISTLGPNDLLQSCEANNNLGVFNEFGPLPSTLFDSTFFYRPYTGYVSNTFQLTGNLERYKVEYNEYKEQYNVGNEVYGFVTLYYRDYGQYKVLDYLRVDPLSWKQVQLAILEADYEANVYNQLRVKFSTSTCRCVQRVYDLSSTDIVGKALTKACNGVPMTCNTHKIASIAPKITSNANVRLYDVNDKYPGCIEGDNNGVLDVFGPMPTDVTNANLFYKDMKSGYSNVKYQLNGKMENYAVQYSEYRHQFIGRGVYAYLAIYFHHRGSWILLDHLRVNYQKWMDIQTAILEAEDRPNSYSKLRVKYLTADCTCVMRIYDVSVTDVETLATTMSCDGNTPLGSYSTKQTLSQEMSSLRVAMKTSYEAWFPKYR